MLQLPTLPYKGLLAWRTLRAALFVSVLCISGLANAQTILLQDNFNANASNWLLSTVDGANGWLWNSSSGVGGTGDLKSQRVSTGNYIISQGVSLVSGVTYTYSFATAVQYGGGRRTVSFAINTTRALNGSEVVKYTTPALSSSTFTTYSTNFTVPSSGTYYMIMYGTRPGTLETALNIDDVSLTTTSANQPPTVSITAPTAGTLRPSGNTSISATASDPDGSITKVEFYEGSTLLGTDNSAPYSYFGSFASGSHTLTAKAYDNSGATTTSSSVTFACNDVPTGAITFPANGASFGAGNISLKATATDTDGSIDHVDFFVDGLKVGTDITYPYEVINPFTTGAHTIYISVVDDQNFAFTTSTISVTATTPVPQTLLTENFDVNPIYTSSPAPSTSWAVGRLYTAHRFAWNATAGENSTGGMQTDGCGSDDYVSPPQQTLDPLTQYNIIIRGSQQNGTNLKSIVLAYNSTRSRTGAINVDTFKLPNCGYGCTGSRVPFGTGIYRFTPPSSAPLYLLLYNIGSTATYDYFDNFTLEKNIIPTVSLSAPANNASFNEGTGPITLTANAADDGQVKKVEFYVDDVLLNTDTLAPYSYSWANYLPGVHKYKAIVEDNRYNRITSSENTFTVNFSDGTLGPYAQWSFNTAVAPWTPDGSSTVQYKACCGYQGGSYIYYLSGSFMYSPLLFLTGGQTYKWSWRADGSSTSNKTCNFYYNSTPTLTGATLFHSVGINSSSDYALQNSTFTPPANGPYYIIFNVTQTGSVQIALDEFRLIGNINTAPDITITAPDNTALIAQGATINITANASDIDGTVASVEFFNGNTSLGVDYTPPYSATDVGLAPGTYYYSAVVVDNGGGYKVSAVTTITIDPNRLQESTYLGGSGNTEAVRGVAVLPNGTIAVAANIGDAAPGGLTPNLLNGATASSVGAILKYASDGTTLVSVTRVANSVNDIAKDTLGNIYVAAGLGGLLKLNGAATSLTYAKTYSGNGAYRVDAGKTGHCAVLTRTGEDFDNEQMTNTTTYVYDPAGTQLSSFATSGTNDWCGDVALDSKSQTVFNIGTKNFNTPGEPGGGSNPVYVPSYKARSYAGVLKYDGYDWSSDQNDPRWLNKAENNMADTKTEKCAIGDDGNLYIIYQVAGGNHILRYDPFDNLKKVSIVGGDQWFSFSNTTTAPKLFVGRYRTSDGAYLLGQQFTPRLSSGSDNSFFTKNGNVAADYLGRVAVVASSGSGLPINLEYIPGGYKGGSALLVLSPDFATRELCTRFTTGGIGRAAAFGAGSSTLVVGGSTSSADLLTYSPTQSTFNGAGDGYLVIGNFSGRYSWKPDATHPRLFFSSSDLAGLRSKSSTAPFNAMLTKIDALRALDDFGVAAQDTTYFRSMTLRAALSAFMYTINQNESYASDARKWVEKAINGQLIDTGTGLLQTWADPSLKGLNSYWMSTRVSECYDWCFNSPKWDDNFKYLVSTKLKKMADMLTNNGGAEQNSDDASNWQGIRGAASVLTYLALDNPYSSTNLTNMYNKVTTYISANLGSTTGSKGWNVEGLGYTYYPWGNFIGPMGIAMKRFDGSRDISSLQSVRNTYWGTVAGNSTALDLLGYGGLRPDFSDDNPHIDGEGTFGQAFYYGDAALLPQYKWVYDRSQGTSAPFGAKWDGTRGGTIWSYLYYPSATTASDPMASSAWLANNLDNNGGNGMFLYRKSYANGDDHIAQFKAKTRNSAGSHDGPDALGFRIIGNGSAWVVGGGRNTPGNSQMQAGLYSVNPAGTTFTTNRNTATLQGTPTSFSNGAGHCIASLATDNLAVGTHKRWFVASYNTAVTGADAVYIIGDESTNGQYFQLPTWEGNTITTTSGNTFTITAPNGATMKGTVLQPTSNFRYATGTLARGSVFGSYLNNDYINLQSDNGDYLIVLTLKKTGSHPTVSYSGTGVTGATVTVGAGTYQLNATDVVYGGGAPRLGLAEANLGTSLYPNPANQGVTQLTVADLAPGEEATYTVLDVEGRAVAEGKTTGGTAAINVGKTSGLYLVRVATALGTQVLKLAR